MSQELYGGVARASRRIALAGLVGLGLAGLGLAGCNGTIDVDERSARSELQRHFPTWRVVTADDLTREDFARWSADHPGAAPGFASGDYFGDGRTAYAALLTHEEEGRGRRVRLVILGLNESGRFESYPLFTESDFDLEMPAIFTSEAGAYQVFIDEQAVPVPYEGVVYTHPGERAKLFFWTGKTFQEVELDA